MKDLFWLDKRLDEIKKTKRALASVLGVSPARLNDYENGKWRFQANHIKKAAEFLGFDRMSFLAFVSGEISEDQLWNSTPPEQKTETIPVIGYVQAGLWQEAHQWNVSDFKPVNIPFDDVFKGKRIFALEVRGNSMNLLYPAGSCVVCVSVEDYADVCGAIENGRKVVVQRRNPFDGSIEATVKEYIQNEQGTYLVPRSTDPSFSPIRIDDGSAGETKITAVVIGSFRKE